MDIVSHALVGWIFGIGSSDKGQRFKTALFGALPDIFQLPLYLYIGYSHGRSHWWPENSDWMGFRYEHPFWSWFWEIPHSLVFLAAMLMLAIVWKWLDNIPMLLAYLSHLIIDGFTHTGEWSLKPIFPLPYSVSGFTDAWAWDWHSFCISWSILAAIISLAELSVWLRSAYIYNKNKKTYFD